MQHEFVVLEPPPQLVFERELPCDSGGHFARMELVALAGFPGFQQRRFGIGKQRVHPCAIVRVQRDSRLRRHAQLGIVHPERLREALAPDPLDVAADLGPALDIGHHDRKMIGAYSRDVGAVCCALQALRQLREQFVARLPAERIIDRLEALDIDQNQRQLALRLLRGVQVLAHPLVEQVAIGQTGEHVVIGKVVEPGRLFDMVERERNVARQLGQQLHFLFVEEPRLGSDQRERSCRLSGHEQRQHDHGPEARCQHLVLQQDSRVELDVVRNHGTRVADCLRGKRALSRRVPADVDVQRGSVFTADALPGDRLQAPRFPVHQPDPGDPEPARLDRDPARLAEQLVAFAHTHDQRVDPAQDGVHAIQPPDLLVGPLSLGDVAGDSDDQRAAFREQRATMKFGPASAAVVASERTFLPEPLSAGRDHVVESAADIFVTAAEDGLRIHLQQPLARVAEPLAGRVVYVDKTHGRRIGQEDRVGRYVHRHAESLQLALGALALGDIGEDGHAFDDLPLFVEARARRDDRIYAFPVLAQPRYLITLPLAFQPCRHLLPQNLPVFLVEQ